MVIDSICIHNFRKLYQCHIDFSEDTTLFVGANNSGKTSAMDAMAKFLAGRSFGFNDFTLSNRSAINAIGETWEKEDCTRPESIDAWKALVPTMDIWIYTRPNDIHYVLAIIPTLKWRGGLLGVRLIFQPAKIEQLFDDYREAFNAARDTEKHKSGESQISLYPKNLCEFLEKNLLTYFTIKSYILDPQKYGKETPQDTDFGMECQSNNPLRGIIKVDMVSAQRGFSDPDNPDAGKSGTRRLSSQMRKYYDKHLDPEKLPTPEDMEIIEVTEKARSAFDENLSRKFQPAIKELEELGYPGVANPKITVKSHVVTTEILNHDSAIQYTLGNDEEPFTLPEKFNGLGYQNLISLVFDLMSFRDGWMRKGKAASTQRQIEPLHLVLVEEPEAHLHMQVQQVFIRKAYSILRNHEKLRDTEDFSTQLIISTHSSHIAREEKFSNLRYFKRLDEGFECCVPTSKVVNLSDVFGKNNETNKFATRYLQTTHCDIFFADAVILVEGSAEDMIIPHFIRNKFPTLAQRYISILCINGKHSHRLGPLLEKLALPTLVIADLDSARPEGHHKKAPPEREKGLISGNYTITGWLMKEKSFDKLLDLPKDKKIIHKHSICDFETFIAYQTPYKLDYNGHEVEALARTFEDSLIYENLDLFTGDLSEESGTLITTVHRALASKVPFTDLVNTVFDCLNKSDVKAEFALDLIYTFDPSKIKVPSYIQEGLDWLQEQLKPEV